MEDIYYKVFRDSREGKILDAETARDVENKIANSRKESGYELTDNDWDCIVSEIMDVAQCKGFAAGFRFALKILSDL